MLVCPSIWLSAGLLKTHEPIFMKLSGHVDDGPRRNQLHFSDDLVLDPGILSLRDNLAFLFIYLFIPVVI